jgi:hypothetical protein
LLSPLSLGKFRTMKLRVEAPERCYVLALESSGMKEENGQQRLRRVAEARVHPFWRPPRQENAVYMKVKIVKH